MARYIDADKFTERIKASPAFRNVDYGLLLQRVVIDVLNNMPAADVVQKSEVAIEIFAKLREDFYEKGMKLNNELSKAIRENNHIEENTLLALASGMRAARRIIADCEAEFMAGANKSEILYGGPREGGKKHAEKEREEWKKRGKL